MKLKDNISIHFTELTKNDKKITSQLMKTPDLLIDKAIQEAAVSLDVSPAAIMRTVKKLGYKGLSDFKNALEEYKNELSGDIQQTEPTNFSHSIIQTYKNNLDAIAESFSEAQLKNIVHLMKTSKTTRALGIGSSGLSANQFVYSFLYQEKYIEAVTSRTKIYYLSRDLDENDLFIIYTVSGNLSVFQELFDQAKKKKAKIVLITMSHNDKLKKAADEIIILPSTLTDFSEQNSLRQLDNRFAFLVFSEILAAYYLENH